MSFLRRTRKSANGKEGDIFELEYLYPIDHLAMNDTAKAKSEGVSKGGHKGMLTFHVIDVETG